MGLDSPEKTFLGDKFDNLVIAYHIPKDNIYNSGMFLSWIRRKYENLYAYNKTTHICLKYHSWILQSGHLKGHKLISQKALYCLGTITVAGYTLIRIAYLYHTQFLLEHRGPVCTNINGLNKHVMGDLLLCAYVLSGNVEKVVRPITMTCYINCANIATGNL